MRFTEMNHVRFRTLLLLALAALLQAAGASGQSTEARASALVEFLAQPALGEMLGLSPCSIERKNRPVVQSLAELGIQALPAIVQALDDFEGNPDGSKFATNANWLMIVYAQIEGRTAFRRLQRMTGNPNPVFAALNRDGILGLSLGLTSYVSGSGLLGRKFYCGGTAQPRDVLNQLILAWLKGETKWLELSFSSKARASLKLLIKDRNLEVTRGEIRPEKSSRSGAIGYRFQIPGLWAEPVESLTSKRGREAPEVATGELEIDTLFTDSVGEDCGRHLMKFIPAQDSLGQRAYLVNNTDLKKLLQTITSCAARSSATP